MFKLCLLSTVIMLILNLTGVIVIPWIAVFTPLLALFLILVVIVTIVIIIGTIIYIYK